MTLGLRDWAVSQHLPPTHPASHLPEVDRHKNSVEAKISVCSRAPYAELNGLIYDYIL